MEQVCRLAKSISRALAVALISSPLVVHATRYAPIAPERLTREEQKKFNELYPDFARECASGQWSSCIKAGAAAEMGAKSESFPDPPMRYYQRACDGGYPEGCAFVHGQRLWIEMISGRPSSNAPAEESAKSREELSKLCVQGVAAACFFMGNLATTEDSRRHYYTRACDLGEPWACWRATYEISNPPRIPEGPELQEWVRLLAVGCRLNEASCCIKLGRAYRTPGFVRQDFTLARQYLKTACDGGSSAGCEELGLMAAAGEGGRKDPRRAQALYEKACTKPDSYEGCWRAGVGYRDGVGAQRNPDRALDYFVRGEEYDPRCRVEHGMMMIEGGGRHGNPVDGVRSVRGACSQYGGYGCYQLGRLALANPWIGEVLQESPVGILEAGCHRPYSSEGCLLLGLVRMNGGGGSERDPERGRQILGEICEQRIEGSAFAEACRRLKENDFNIPVPPLVNDPRTPRVQRAPQRNWGH